MNKLKFVQQENELSSNMWSSLVMISSSNCVWNTINFTVLNFHHVAWVGSFIALHIATQQLYCILLSIYYSCVLHFCVDDSIVDLCTWFWFYRILGCNMMEKHLNVLWIVDSSFWWNIPIARKKKKFST